MSKLVSTYYFVLHQGMSHSKYSWRREYLKLTLGKVDRLESVVEYEDKTIYRPRELAFGLPTGTKRSTKLEYTQALLRYRKDAAQRKRLAEVEREQRRQAERKLVGIRGMGARPVVPAPTVATQPINEASCFDDFTIVDTEYQGEFLLEVAAIRYQNWQPVEQHFVSFVRFAGWIGPRVKELTGITETQVYRAPPEKTVLERLQAYVGNSLLIAHNIGADRSRLEAAARRQGMPLLPNKWFCTLALSRARLPKGAECGLEKLCQRFNFSNKNAHRALSDVGRTFLVLRHFHEEAPLRSLDPKARQAQPALF